MNEIGAATHVNLATTTADTEEEYGSTWKQHSRVDKEEDRAQQSQQTTK